MKHFLKVLPLILAMGMIGLPAQAANVTTHIDNSIQVYQDDFDILVLDFDLNVDALDTLNTLTVSVAGAARYNIEYYNIKLWADEGEVGFQGWEYDQLLKTATQNGPNFVFENIGHEFFGTNRFFVSIDSGSNFVEKTAQFLLGQPNDKSGDGIWQVDEQGIFLANEGVLTEYNGQSFTRTIFFRVQKIDQLGPKGTFDDMSIDSGNPTLIIDPDLPVVFKGDARDRNTGTVRDVDVLVNDSTFQATNMIANQTIWELEYTPTNLLENLTLRLSLMDSANNLYVTSPRYAIVDTRIPDANKTTISLSDTTIEADGSDALITTVTLRDEEGDVLRDRALEVIIHKNGESKTVHQISTDSNGEATVSNTFADEGDYSVDVYYRGEKIKGTTFVVGTNNVVEIPEPVAPAPNQTGDLIKASQDAVYYFSSLGKRHVFLSQDIYASWYGDDFDEVKVISDADLADIPMGAPVSFRPGTMLTAPSVNEVYLVTPGREIRHIESEKTATKFFGAQWNTLVHDLSESLLFVYIIGDPIITDISVNLPQILSTPMLIDDELTAD